jgi:hypothetical protein
VHDEVGENEIEGDKKREALEKDSAKSEEEYVAMKKDRLRYEPMYKPKPMNRQPHEERRATGEGWTSLLWRITLGRIERRRQARILAKSLQQHRPPLNWR